jgi:hypothetical protein
MADQTITLDVINVSKPCLASWDAMRGNDQLRFCDGCGKNVHNLSAMTKRQAADLLEACAGAGELCVRFARLPDGAVATLDYRAAPTGGSRGWRFWAAFGTCLAAGVAAVNAVAFSANLPRPSGGRQGSWASWRCPRQPLRLLPASARPRNPNDPLKPAGSRHESAPAAGGAAFINIRFSCRPRLLQCPGGRSHLTTQRQRGSKQPGHSAHETRRRRNHETS